MRDSKGRFIKGYNGRIGIYHTQESKKKMRLTKLGKKGHTPWNKGLTKNEHSSLKRISDKLIGNKLHLGHKHEYKSRLKTSLANKGKIPWMKGKKHSEYAKEQNRLKHVGKMVGEKHYNWMGGKSFEPYGLEFNKQLKEQIRKRDDWIDYFKIRINGGDRIWRANLSMQV